MQLLQLLPLLLVLQLLQHRATADDEEAYMPARDQDEANINPLYRLHTRFFFHDPHHCVDDAFLVDKEGKWIDTDKIVCNPQNSWQTNKATPVEVTGATCGMKFNCETKTASSHDNEWIDLRRIGCINFKDNIEMTAMLRVPHFMTIICYIHRRWGTIVRFSFILAACVFVVIFGRRVCRRKRQGKATGSPNNRRKCANQKAPAPADAKDSVPSEEEKKRNDSSFDSDAAAFHNVSFVAVKSRDHPLVHNSDDSEGVPSISENDMASLSSTFAGSLRMAAGHTSDDAESGEGSGEKYEPNLDWEQSRETYADRSVFGEMDRAIDEESMTRHRLRPHDRPNGTYFTDEEEAEADGMDYPLSAPRRRRTRRRGVTSLTDEEDGYGDDTDDEDETLFAPPLSSTAACVDCLDKEAALLRLKAAAIQRTAETRRLHARVKRLEQDRDEGGDAAIVRENRRLKEENEVLRNDNEVLSAQIEDMKRMIMQVANDGIANLEALAALATHPAPPAAAAVAAPRGARATVPRAARAAAAAALPPPHAAVQREIKEIRSIYRVNDDVFMEILYKGEKNTRQMPLFLIPSSPMLVEFLKKDFPDHPRYYDTSVRSQFKAIGINIARVVQVLKIDKVVQNA